MLEPQKVGCLRQQGNRSIDVGREGIDRILFRVPSQQTFRYVIGKTLNRENAGKLTFFRPCNRVVHLGERVLCSRSAKQQSDKARRSHGTHRQTINELVVCLRREVDVLSCFMCTAGRVVLYSIDGLPHPSVLVGASAVFPQEGTLFLPSTLPLRCSP